MRVQIPLAAAALLLSESALAAPDSDCKCFPGESCWPTASEWNQLNVTVGGRLIATVPLGQPCHDPGFDNATCTYLQSQWQWPGIHMNNSASVMAPYFANQSCDPFTARSLPCTLGNYVRYAVEVETAQDVVAAIGFARKNNIRFVIRNTGHDYLGRSTGAGALAVWTHKLKDITFTEWSDEYYQGDAVRLGAGVQGFEILSAGLAEGKVVVGGECPTVGVAGGYTQGGGHSALSTAFGLSADNVLEWEVVTADGTHLTATRTKNADLYWALAGGGPGNYAVVLSMTVKAHPESYVSGATLTFNAADVSNDTFYAAIDAFHAALPALVDSGAMIIYFFSSDYFSISPLTGYNMTQQEVETAMFPLLSKLKSLNVPYTSAFSQSATYYDHFDKYLGPLPIGNIQVGIAQYGGRLVPRRTVVENAAGLGETARFVASQGVTWIGVGTDVSRFGGSGDSSSNAVLPAWREALVHVTLSTPWSFDPAEWNAMLANQALMTDVVMPAVEAVTPGSGAYMNEADFRQPNFQDVFFGSNYPALLAIKQRWDPDALFYADKAVGSEFWSVAENGAMCRVSKKKTGRLASPSALQTQNV